MQDYFESYFSDSSWQCIEHEWNPHMQNVNESKFSLGNGYVCSRGVLEEIPIGANPGTFFAGLYDNTGAQVTELINAPNPIDIKLTTNGERVGALSMDVINHTRSLDMKNGVLYRKTLFSNSRKKRFDYQSARFFSMHNKNVAVMRIYFTPLDDNETLTIDSSIDTSIVNKGLITEGNKKHFHISHFSKDKSVNYLALKTLQKETIISYASQLKIKQNKKTFSPTRRAISNLKIKKGETICITKYFSFYTQESGSKNISKIKSKTVSNLKHASKQGFDVLFSENLASWDKLWKTSDVVVYHNDNVTKAIRFNLYHLLITASESVTDVSVGAKTLTGEGYRGHVFWDTELFILPFFLFTNPDVAKNLLLYRYNRLDAARKNARDRGYLGVMFPWESADLGTEVTPSWYKDKNGNIMKVTTGVFEHHITADIAYSVASYYTVTDDNAFMLKYGLEMVFETARFWKSRTEFNSKKKYYEIKGVIGPDEFHENVNNNAFTNIIAKWNLNYARIIYSKFKRKYPEKLAQILKKIKMSLHEINSFKDVESNMFVPMISDEIIEQFEGFSKLKKYSLPPRTENMIPNYKKKFDDVFISKSQFVKQADVLMIFLLFPEFASKAFKKKNYKFYERRTLHFSSLSTSVHAIIGIETREFELAYKYFVTALHADLNNVYHNTADGIHAASLGGVWQIMVYGFAGIRIVNGELSCHPNIPDFWVGMKCSIIWKGYLIQFFIRRKNMTIHLSSHSHKKKGSLKILVYGYEETLKNNASVTFEKKNYKDIKF